MPVAARAGRTSWGSTASSHMDDETFLNVCRFSACSLSGLSVVRIVQAFGFVIRKGGLQCLSQPFSRDLYEGGKRYMLALLEYPMSHFH